MVYGAAIEKSRQKEQITRAVFFFGMSIDLTDVTCIDLAVTVNIALQMDPHILRHRFRTHRHRIRPGDVAFFDTCMV